MENNEINQIYRNRVIEVKRMRVGDVLPNSHNWKIHPDKQKKVLDDILIRIGIAGVLPAYYSERNDFQLTFIDGHARRELNEDAIWDIAILDVTDKEADLLLSVYDPISKMAVISRQAYDDLLKSVQTDSEAMMELISQTTKDTNMYFKDESNKLVEGDSMDLSIEHSSEEDKDQKYEEDNLPESFPEYGEEIENDVKYIECPKCGYRFPQ